MRSGGENERSPMPRLFGSQPSGRRNPYWNGGSPIVSRA
jgi:hypothetical protein